MTDRMPVVSVVIPMLDERHAVEPCVASLERQDYDLDRLDVMIVDGGSTDGSRELVAELAATRPWLRVVDNPDRRASSGFNRGIEHATGDIVCIVSAHGELGSDYVSRSVKVLDESGAAGVGGRLLHAGTDPTGRAIGAAMTSPFGMASPFRYATTRREVDTIGHPAYRRSLFDEVGLFDETLERNSDYDLNQRIREAGHTLVFDPEIVTVYRPRADLAGLARQFWWYGRWKAHAVHRRPASLRPRHLVAPAAVAAGATLPLLLRCRWGRRVTVAGGAAYTAAAVAAAARARSEVAEPTDLATTIAAFPVMHASWGAGFLTTLLRWFR